MLNMHVESLLWKYFQCHHSLSNQIAAGASFSACSVTYDLTVILSLLNGTSGFRPKLEQLDERLMTINAKPN